MTLMRADFRVRKTGAAFYVWQIEAGRWVKLSSYQFNSRLDALAWIAAVCEESADV